MAIKINNTTIIDDSRNIVNAGVVTATSFVGTVTGTASTATAAGTAYGLTGSPNVTVGVLTATTISTGSTTGTAGQVLQSTGTGVTWTPAAAGGLSITDSNVIGYNSAGIRSDSANGRLAVFGTGNFQVFTSPGTYVVNPGISSIRVRVVGAGGNGAPVSSPPNGGGGGGGGGYAHKVITSFTAPRTYTVTVGSAPGGTSSFGSEVSATGGSNGSGSTGGSGGSGSSGDFNATGASGGSGGAYLPYAPSSGDGGAAGSQKGNGSGSSISDIPGKFSSRFVSRFPFDIFEGYNGGITGFISPTYAPVILTLTGYEGGSGMNGFQNFFSNYAGTAGGTGGGGGGGSQSPGSARPGASGGIGAGGGGGSPTQGFSPVPTASGGAGGAGIVIVEW
jgi:hypothetical protein